MSKILELLCTEYENVYGLKMKKNYSVRFSNICRITFKRNKRL